MHQHKTRRRLTSTHHTHAFRHMCEHPHSTMLCIKTYAGRINDIRGKGQKELVCCFCLVEMCGHIYGLGYYMYNGRVAKQHPISSTHNPRPPLPHMHMLGTTIHIWKWTKSWGVFRKSSRVLLRGSHQIYYPAEWDPKHTYTQTH